MRRVGLIATREFMAAVANRNFVIGLLIMPAMVAVLAVVMPRVLNGRNPPISGEVAVIDQTGDVLNELRAALQPAAIARRRAETAARALAEAPAVVRDAAAGSDSAVDRVLGTPPDLHIVERPADADVQQEKEWLRASSQGPRRLALLVVHKDAAAPQPGRPDYGTYDLYVSANLDDRVETTIYEGLREAVVSARIRVRDMDRSQVEAVMRFRRPASVTVTAGDERQTNVGFNRALPFAFAGLLVFGIMIGGQTLLTSTIEEKSSRVIEVLLSAVSPLELMAGKILGQMAVSMLVLALYVGAGLMLLTSFAMIGLLDPMLIIYMLVFFLISYLVFAAVFSAVGAAVNEMREAQSLMTPVMLLLMAPWMFGPVISREPSSTFSVALSFIPPVNTFAMMTRLASSAPPPLWQVGVTVVIGLASALAATWFAAKVFKVGLLMHGKPPSFGTLVRWAREA
jgi:ABC-2 type transport system permease protein